MRVHITIMVIVILLYVYIYIQIYIYICIVIHIYCRKCCRRNFPNILHTCANLVSTATLILIKNILRKTGETHVQPRIYSLRDLGALRGMIY